MPSASELQSLANAVGWAGSNEKPPAGIPQTAVAHTVIAENKTTGEVIGCAFLLTDNAGFYYIKNVIVQPSWQGQRIGTALVKHLDDWLKEHAPTDSTVALHTGPNLAPFYRQFGFFPAFSMQKKMLRD
ncbi:MAG: GNAT family N-acetyltransferase [Chitinophagaceae bacterium]